MIATAKATLKNTAFMHDDTLKWYNEVCKNDDFVSSAVVFAFLTNDKLVDYAYSLIIKQLHKTQLGLFHYRIKKSSELIY